MNNKFIISFLFIAASVYYINQYSNTPNNDSYLQGSQNTETDSDKINFLLIGDYGSGTYGQKEVANYMNEISGQVEAEFVIGTGDNFYNPNGVSGLDDPEWDNKWANVYQNKENLKDLTWFGTIGNHDYGGEGLFSEFEYKKHGWRIDDFFWAHTAQVGDKSVAFIHVDTSFLAYGIEGQSSKPLMKDYFQELGWTDNQQMLDYADELLYSYANYDWKIVIGHHQIGYSCQPVENTNLYYDIFEKHKVDAYLSGHAHQLSYAQHGDMGFILSGAGGFAEKGICDEIDPMFYKQLVFGFMSIELSENYLNTKVYYTDRFKVDWQSKNMVTLRRREK